MPTEVAHHKPPAVQFRCALALIMNAHSAQLVSIMYYKRQEKPEEWCRRVNARRRTAYSHQRNGPAGHYFYSRGRRSYQADRELLRPAGEQRRTQRVRNVPQLTRVPAAFCIEKRLSTSAFEPAIPLLSKEFGWCCQRGSNSPLPRECSTTESRLEIRRGRVERLFATGPLGEGVPVICS